MQIGAKESIQFEIAFPCPVIGSVNLAIERQDECYRMLGDRVRRIFRYADDLDAVRRCRRQVDIVEAGAAQRDESSATARQCRKHWRIDPIVDEHAHRAATSGERHRRGLEQIVEEDQLVAGLGVSYSQQLAIVAFGTENGDLHDSMLLTLTLS